MSLRKMRERIYEIIEISKGDDLISQIYDSLMMIIIIVSLIPLAFKKEVVVLQRVETIVIYFFVFDYILRFLTADFKYKKKSIGSFLKYPFSIMAIIDLLSILPSLKLINNGFKILRLTRVLRGFRVLRVFRSFRYSKNAVVIVSVLKRTKEPLVAVGGLAVSYIITSALLIFNVEPETFDTFFNAIYWATISLTTVGYGDIYPITTLGKIVTMVSSLFGIAIIALPAGIITAEYMNQINKNKE